MASIVTVSHACGVEVGGKSEKERRADGNEWKQKYEKRKGRRGNERQQKKENGTNHKIDGKKKRMNEMEVTRKQKKRRQIGWNLGAPPVCHCCVRCNQSCGHFAICCHSTTVLLVLLREEPVLLQQRRFFVNNGRLCDAMSITECICSCWGYPSSWMLALLISFRWASHVFLHLPNLQ